MPEAQSTNLETHENTTDESASLALLGGVLARIQVHEPSFTTVEHRIAAALTSNGRELVGVALEDLATRIGVSQASIIRFCRRLGYSGLRELKLALAAEVRGDPRAVALPIAAGDSYAAIARKVTVVAQQALIDSLDVLDPNALERATEALLGASRIQIFGVGGSAPIAQDAHYRLARLGMPVAVQTDPYLQSVVAANMGSGTAAFVVSHTGRSREPVHVLEEAKNSGAKTILLTSYANTPAAKLADIVLLTAPVETTPWGGMAPLRVAQLSVIDMLCVAIADRDPVRKSLRSRYDSLLTRHVLADEATAERSDNGKTTEHGADQLGTVVRTSAIDRTIAIDGVENARHMGGFRLANGTEVAPSVIRSGMLWEITPAGIARLRELGVTAIVDLRHDAELERFPTPNLQEAGIEIVRAPMYDHGWELPPDNDDHSGWITVYRRWAELSLPAMRALAETIAGAQGTVLMHCHLGADRTGIASALLLDLIGVNESDILADYVMSPSNVGAEFLILSMLERIRKRFSSTAGYFTAAGVSRATVAKVRERMIVAGSN